MNTEILIIKVVLTIIAVILITVFIITNNKSESSS